MPRPIAAFTGDNHLRPTTWIKRPDLYGDTYDSFRQFFDYCLAQRLPAILLGDLFDKMRPDSLSVGSYLWNVWRMHEQNLPVYYIEGNHDKADPPWASLDPWARQLGTYDLGGIPTYGLSFTNSAELAAELANIPPGTRLLLTHQSWLEIQRVGHTDGAFAMIPHGLTMLTGDYHVCGTYTGTAANGEPVIVLYDDLSVTWYQLNTRRVINVTCQTSEELDSLLARISLGPLTPIPDNTHPDIRKPILRVQYNDAVPEAYSRLTAAAGELFHLFLEPKHQVTEQIVDVTAAQPTAFESLMSAVVELSPPESQQAATACRLLRSSTPKEEIDKIFEEYKATYTATHVVAP